jgi:hypothetical protein
MTWIVTTRSPGSRRRVSWRPRCSPSSGLPPVDLHAPLHYLAVMDPLCGMTRGVRLVARGDLAGAVRYNPAAPLVPFGGGLLLVRAAHGHRTGR